MTSWRALLSAATLERRALRNAFRLALEQSNAVSTVAEPPDDSLRLTVTTKTHGKRFDIDLNNLFANAVHAEPGRREELLLLHLAAMRDLTERADGNVMPPSRDQIVPTIKTTQWIAGMPAKQLASEPLVGDLVVVYAFDDANTITYAEWPDVGPLIPDRSEVRQVSLTNLRARLPNQLATRGDGRSFILLAGGNYEASLILLDEVWADLARTVAGDIIVCPLARDICLVTGTGVSGGVASLLDARNRLLARDPPPAQLITSSLLRREDRGWQLFQPRN